MRLSLASYCVAGLIAGCAYAAPTNAEAGLTPRWVHASDLHVPYAPHLDKRNGENKKSKHRNKNKDKNNNDEEVDIRVTDLVVSEKIGNAEITFEKKVTKILIKNKGSNKKKNHKRKESMKNKHKNVNIVIQVVQVVIDVASGNSKRYAMSALLADQGSNATTTCQVTDAQTLTVGSGNCTGLDAGPTASNLILTDPAATAAASATGLAALAPSGAAAASIAAAAPVNMANQTVLLPANASAPEAAAGVEVMDDPAAELAYEVTGIC